MKIKLVILFVIAFSIVSCENQENDFPDFGSESVFFPLQTPARTLIQGEYDLGFNDNDNAGRFIVGIRMSGVRNNNMDRRVSFELAPELIDVGSINTIDPTRLMIDSVNVKILPASYYTIEQESPVTMPSGSTQADIPIQLEDAFFDDPLSYAPFGEVHYVLPLKITGFEGLDSLLTGIPAFENPIKVRADDWDTQPKDYTLYGIKYINKYHGSHLRRGSDIAEGTIEEVTTAEVRVGLTEIDTTVVYNREFVVDDEVTLVSTSGRNKATVNNFIRRGNFPSSEIALEMAFDANEDITISGVEGGNQTVSGTGKWIDDGDEWGGKRRNAIYLEYTYRDLDTLEIRSTFGNRLTGFFYVDLLHTVKDTLVMRDRDVKFEQFAVEFKEQ